MASIFCRLIIFYNKIDNSSYLYVFPNIIPYIPTFNSNIPQEKELGRGVMYRGIKQYSQA